MLQVLFGRYSRLVPILEACGLGLAGLNLLRALFEASWRVPDTLLTLLLFQYLFIRACRWINWYPEAQHRRRPDPELGIEVHFLKALVPTSYILFAASLLFLGGLEWTAMILANLMLLVITGVNGILVTFHFRDDRLLPVNYFTRNLYLQEQKTQQALASREPEVPAA